MISEQQDVRKQSGQTAGECSGLPEDKPVHPSASLPHQQPSALKLIQLELDGSNLLCRLGIVGLDRPEHLTSLAHEHDPEAALHSARELGRGVFGLGAAGWHGGMKLDV